MTLSVPLIASGLIVGCGGDPGANQSANQSEHASEVVSAVVSGATNVSDGIVPFSTAESETAAVGIGAVLAVAYNSPYVPNPGERCYGNSATGMSYWNGNIWNGIHFAPPSGVALLRGDPSIGAWDNGTGNYQVYISTLAHSQDQWNAQPTQPDGCISQSTYDNMLPDELCVIRVSVPMSGGYTASVIGTTCMAPGGNVDGTALVVSRGTPYVASWDTSSGIVFFRASDGARLPSPLTSQAIVGHPIFTKNDNSVHLFAPDAAGTFWETFYNASTGSWDAGASVPSSTSFSWGSPLPFGLRGGKEYSAIYLPGSAGPGADYLFFRDTRELIVGYAHSTGGIPGWSLAFTSEPGLSAFHPAAAVAAVPNEYSPYTGFHLALSYWDNSGGSTATLKYTNSLSTTPTVIGSETPCPHNGYWGDYDEMAVWNNNTSNPIFYRFFTDSTTYACQADTTDWTDSTPQHVSILGHER